MIAVGAQVLGAAVAATAWDEARTTKLLNTSERIDAAGESIAVFTDVVQPDIVCTATAPGRRVKPVELAPAPVTISNTSDDATWYLIAFLADGRERLKVQCKPKAGGSDSATYMVGVTSVSDRAGTVIAWIGLLLGTGLAATVFAARYSAARGSAASDDPSRARESSTVDSGKAPHSGTSPPSGKTPPSGSKPAPPEVPKSTYQDRGSATEESG